MKPIAGLASLLLFGSGACQAQPEDSPKRDEFEVAAIRPLASQPNGSFRLDARGGPGTSDPTHVTYTNLSLKTLLMRANNFQPYQIVAPDWLDSAEGRFVIEATIRPGATKEQANRMLQNLLVDRFRMTLHRETRELPLYELVVGKNGPKLKESQTKSEVEGLFSAVMAKTGSRKITGQNAPVADLVRVLNSPTFGPVLDKTGLTMKYDFTLEFALPDAERDALASQGQLDSQAGPQPDLFTAVQEQLGLKLEPKKGPMEVLVVEHAEKKPVEN